MLAATNSEALRPFGIIFVFLASDKKSKPMKKIMFLFTVILSFNLSAQFKFNTGDAEMDNDLISINADAKLNFDAFQADLTTTFGVSTKNLDYMVSINMEPAEMYLALEISSSVNKPVESVIDMYEANRDKGWGYVAQQMGIKPGSPEFQALKGKSKTKKENTSKNGNAGNVNGNGNSNKSTVPVNGNSTPTVHKKK